MPFSKPYWTTEWPPPSGYETLSLTLGPSVAVGGTTAAPEAGVVKAAPAARVGEATAGPVVGGGTDVAVSLPEVQAVSTRASTASAEITRLCLRMSGLLPVPGNHREIIV